MPLFFCGRKVPNCFPERESDDDGRMQAKSCRKPLCSSVLIKSLIRTFQRCGSGSLNLLEFETYGAASKN
ncbi:MAG: hypothetical protein M0P44_08015, partial [Clostridiales bacterium]|nr:hypothetical protein [Clostridiales bacterium]